MSFIIGLSPEFSKEVGGDLSQIAVNAQCKISKSAKASS